MSNFDSDVVVRAGCAEPDGSLCILQNDQKIKIPAHLIDDFIAMLLQCCHSEGSCVGVWFQL